MPLLDRVVPTWMTVVRYIRSKREAWVSTFESFFLLFVCFHLRSSSPNLSGDASSFLYLDVVFKFICKCAVNFLLGFAQVHHLLLLYLVLVSLHVGLVHLHRVELCTANVTLQTAILLILVPELFEQFLFGAVPLVFASIVVLLSHLWVVERSRTQRTVFVGILEINL